MASAKSIEAGFLSSMADTGEGECQHSLEHGHGVQYPRHCEPPEYAASSSMPRSGEPLPCVLPFIDFTSYRLQAGTLSADETTRTTTDPGLISNATSLYTLLKEQAALPPKPTVRIRGTHIDYVYSWGTTRTDFDLALDMMPLIVPTSTTRLNYVNIKPNPGDKTPAEPLRSWVQRFCDDPAECKSITLERLVINWDTEFLERKIRSAVLSTKYKGNLEVTFPITNSRVVIVKQASNLSSTTREYSDTSGKQKRLGRSRSPPEMADQAIAASIDDAIAYRPIQAVWPYATSSFAAPLTSQSGSLFSTTVEPQYAVQSERDWWKVWKEPIKNGVLAKKHGWVTTEDWKDVILGQVDWPVPNKSWGTSADDWHLLMKGIKLRGSKRAAPGDIVKGGVR